MGEVVSEDKITQAGGFIGAMNCDRDGSVVIATCYSFGKLSLNVKGFTSRQSKGNILDCVWRKDEDGINEYITDGRNIQELSTGQFGYEYIFSEMGWSITGDANVWHYDDEITPRRPHLNGLPVVNPE